MKRPGQGGQPWLLTITRSIRSRCGKQGGS